MPSQLTNKRLKKCCHNKHACSLEHVLVDILLLLLLLLLFVMHCCCHPCCCHPCCCCYCPLLLLLLMLLLVVMTAWHTVHTHAYRCYTTTSRVWSGNLSPLRATLLSWSARPSNSSTSSSLERVTAWTSWTPSRCSHNQVRFFLFYVSR